MISPPHAATPGAEKLSAPGIKYQTTRMMREAQDMHNNGCQSVLRDQHYDGIWYKRVGKWVHYMEKTLLFDAR